MLITVQFENQLRGNMQPENSNLDELVNQIKSEHQRKPSALSQDHSDSTDDVLNEVKSQFQQQSDEEDDNDLIADIKSQFQQTSQKKTSEDSSLEELKSKFKVSSSPSQESNEDLFVDVKSRYQQQRMSFSSQKGDSDELLGDLKKQHQTEKTQKSQEDYQRNREEILKAEQQQQKKRKYLTRKAQTWLENLDPYSDEGFWFEEFAESYESRLDAAVEYLAVLEDD